jgi:hypothetical protein
MAKTKTDPPRSPEEWVAKLPQFEPDYSIPYHHIDFENGNHRLFSPAREEKIKSLLANFIQTHARSLNWQGKLTGVDRFVENAMTATATFEYRKSRTERFDRPTAKATLRATVSKILDASRALESIAANRELTHFLEQIFVTDMLTDHRRTNPSPKVTAKTLKTNLRRSGQWIESYREISPNVIAAQLMRLEPILTVAAERVEFRPGDFQLDEIAQEFCNELAFAWISGTGQLPTFSKSNPNSRKISAFAELLSLVNGSILDPEYKHDNDFRTYGVKALNAMRKQFPDLAVSHEPRRRR